MTAKLRVLFVSPQPFFDWRGSSIRVKFNLMALAELGYDVDLLTLPIGNDEPAINIRVIRVWNVFGSKRISIGPSLLKLWFDFILLIRGIGLVLRNRYTVLHGTEESGFLCYLLTFICKAKCVYEKHSDSGSYRQGLLKRIMLGVYDLVEKLTIRRCDLVICTGPGLQEQAQAVSTKTNIEMIPDIPSSLNEPSKINIATARSIMTDSSDRIVVTYVGSFAEYQGVDIIFESIPRVIRSNTNIQFVIIGGSDEEIDHFRQKLASRHITKQVRFLGKIDPDELPGYLAASDILLAPRKSGINSPLKILDYFKAGGAIVATNTIANKRLLNDDNAVLCDFDTDSFTSAIIDLSNDAKKRQRLSKNASQLYKTRYNFSIFTKQLDSAYQSIIEGKT